MRGGQILKIGYPPGEDRNVFFLIHFEPTSLVNTISATKELNMPEPERTGKQRTVRLVNVHLTAAWFGTEHIEL
jgi:hypothetical protein